MQELIKTIDVVARRAFDKGSVAILAQAILAQAILAQDIWLWVFASVLFVGATA